MRIQKLNEKSSADFSYTDAILCYKYTYNERVFGGSLKSVLEYEYFKLQTYLGALNDLSLADRNVFSTKLDNLRFNLKDHMNKLTLHNKSLHTWKSLAEKSSELQFEDSYPPFPSQQNIRDLCVWKYLHILQSIIIIV